MTCKDCVHYDICLGAYEDYLYEICDSFKDKSKFIELPCSVGDIVYKIHYIRKACNDCNSYSDFYGTDPICDENKILFPNINDNKKNICHKHHLKISEYKADLIWIIWQLDQFGKSVFLTREEAVKKLEELK